MEVFAKDLYSNASRLSMDRNITAWFYRFAPAESALAVEDVLMKAMELGIPEARERNVGPEAGDAVIVRLERLDSDTDFTWGQFTRVQRHGVPPEASDQGLKELEFSDENSGLGQVVGFRYHKASRVMAIQHSFSSVSATRIGIYLSEINSNAIYEIHRVAREDAWARYGQGEPDKIFITLATPENVTYTEPDEFRFNESVAALAQITNAPMLTVEMSMGRRKGELSKSGIKGLFQKLLSSRSKNEIDLRQLKVRSRNDEERDGVELIDFLNPLLDEKGQISYSGSDPDKIYEEVSLWLQTAFGEHLAHIKKTYVPANN